MRVGFVGWRGMVGSVLRARMTEEGDWSAIDPVFFSTSQVGAPAPEVGRPCPPLADAHDLDALAQLPVLVSCQGSDWTRQVHGPLRARGWRGHFIDASSALRLKDDAVLLLDPINGPAIDAALDAGTLDLVGANCTVSLMLMAVGGLFARGWVSWVSAMTYQAASGAGAAQMRELVAQMRDLGEAAAPLLDDPAADALAIEGRVSARLRDPRHPTAALGHPLAGSLLPWIDAPMADGQSREEWKAMAEGNKLLGLNPPVPMDGLCVRTGSLRCHAQGLTLGLNRDLPLDVLEAAIADSTPWTRVIPNQPEPSLRQLSPAAVSGSLDIAVGRIRKLKTDPRHLGAFTVGDQLLWGAAEPLRRALQILRKRGLGA